MNISLQLAEQIAKACELPSLYLGEFNGLEINYIWTIYNVPQKLDSKIA
jgi:hypothetical protein